MAGERGLLGQYIEGHAVVLPGKDAEQQCPERLDLDRIVDALFRQNALDAPGFGQAAGDVDAGNVPVGKGFRVDQHRRGRVADSPTDAASSATRFIESRPSKPLRLKANTAPTERRPPGRPASGPAQHHARIELPDRSV